MYSWLFSNELIFFPQRIVKSCNKAIKLICIFTKFRVANIGNSYICVCVFKKHICSMAICELPDSCVLLRNYLIFKKITERQVKSWHTIHPLLRRLPTDLFTKHCHVKWWRLGKNTPHAPLHPRPSPTSRCGYLSWDEICLSKPMYIAASIPDS